MRISKLIGALFAVLAFSAVATATASAAETLWKWLPGSVGETFKGKSGKATLQVEKKESPLSITCAKSEVLLSESSLIKEGSTSEKDATLALAIIHFTSCTTLGLPVNSLGDASGVILVHLELHNCMIAAKDFGILFLPLELHLEVPSTKLLLLVKGSFVGLIEGKEGTPALTFKLNIKQTGGLQEFKECAGGTKETLLTKIDTEPEFVTSGEEAAEGTLEFDMAKDKEEELMEK